jgi:hypothetical protein
LPPEEVPPELVCPAPEPEEPPLLQAKSHPDVIRVQIHAGDRFIPAPSRRLCWVIRRQLRTIRVT